MQQDTIKKLKELESKTFKRLSPRGECNMARERSPLVKVAKSKSVLRIKVKVKGKMPVLQFWSVVFSNRGAIASGDSYQKQISFIPQVNHRITFFDQQSAIYGKKFRQCEGLGLALSKIPKSPFANQF